MQNQLKNELHDVISGKSQVRFGTIIQSIDSYLREGTKPSGEIKVTKQLKVQERERLENYISENHLWVSDIDLTQYVSEGAEQRVYLKNSDHVIKLNDAIYYSCWKDYFINLILHNYFFEDTAYELLGFYKEKDVLYAVVQQAFVVITSETDLNQLKIFLESNGFENKKNNDYFNSALGIILEDLHEENVLTRNNILYFIDTVFYLTKDFGL